MLLEFCDGGALDSILVELDRGLNEPQIKYVSQGIGQGLEFLHEHMIIHRDLKAGNVLLTLDGGVKLGKILISEFRILTGPHKIFRGGELLIRPPPYSVFESFGGRGATNRTPLMPFSTKKFIISTFKMQFLLKYLTYNHQLHTKIMPSISST